MDTVRGMVEPEPSAEEKPRDIRLTAGTGSMAITSDGVGLRVQGPNRDGIRVSDPDGTAAVDFEEGVMIRASTTGVPSQNEHGSLATGRVLVRRLNQDGAAWGDPYEVKTHVGGGVDCEARDTNDLRRRIKIQVTRAEIDGAFLTRLHREQQAEVPPSTVDEVALRLWNAVEKKRLYALPDEVLALNAIRTPWAVSRPVVEAFRQRYGQAARRIGFKEVWVVGWSEALTERLDM